MAAAVTTWSPVIITGVMPALRQIFTASRTSGRGGSIMPTRPMSVRPFSNSSEVGFSGRIDIRIGQHAQRLLAHVIDDVLGLLRAAALDTAIFDDVERALDDGDILAVDLMHGGHQFAVGVKGDLGKAGILAVERRLGDAVFRRGGDDGRLVGSPICFSLPFSISMLPSQQSVAMESSWRTASEQLALISSVRRPSTA